MKSFENFLSLYFQEYGYDLDDVRVTISNIEKENMEDAELDYIVKYISDNITNKNIAIAQEMYKTYISYLNDFKSNASMILLFNKKSINTFKIYELQKKCSFKSTSSLFGDILNCQRSLKDENINLDILLSLSEKFEFRPNFSCVNIGSIEDNAQVIYQAGYKENDTVASISIFKNDTYCGDVVVSIKGEQSVEVIQDKHSILYPFDFKNEIPKNAHKTFLKDDSHTLLRAIELSNLTMLEYTKFHEKVFLELDFITPDQEKIIMFDGLSFNSIDDVFNEFMTQCIVKRDIETVLYPYIKNIKEVA